MHDRNRPLKLQVAMYMVQFSVNKWLIGLHPQHVFDGDGRDPNVSKVIFQHVKRV